MKYLLVGASFLSLYVLSRFLSLDLLTIASFFLALPFLGYEIHLRTKNPSDELVQLFTILVVSMPLILVFLLVLNQPLIAKIGLLPFNVSAIWLGELVAPLLALCAFTVFIVKFE